MRKQIVVLLFLMGLASWCHGQNVPKEIIQIIKDYVKDSTMNFGFKEAQKHFRLQDTVKFVNIKVGVPVEKYRLVYSVLLNSCDTLPVRSVVEPIGSWRLLVNHNGKGIYFLEIDSLNGCWNITTMGSGGIVDEWDKVRSAWPENEKINPILIQDNGYEYIHFPQKGEYNLKKLYTLHSKDPNDSIAIRTSRNYTKLEDCRQIFRYIRKDKRERRKAFELNKKSGGIGYGGY